MKHFHGEHWKAYVQDRICPQIQQYGDLVLNRVLPAFDGINEEATALENRRRAELIGSLEGPRDYLYEGAEAAAHLAFNEAMDYAVLLSSMRFSTVNLFSAGLYHLTEQHLVDLPLQILNRDERHNIERQDAVDWLKNRLDLDVKSLTTWPLIGELELVANAVKHGEGRAAEHLRNVRPDLFVHPSLLEEKYEIGIGTMRIRTPLFGEGIYVTREAFARYHTGSVAFWAEIAARLSHCEWVRDAT